MRRIELTRGKFATVDDADFELFGVYSWHCTEHGYSARRDAHNKHHYLHRDILGAKKGEVVDHISGDKLDNRRSNLRICSQAENTWNNRNKKVGKTGLAGVYESDTSHKKMGWKLKKKYAARIEVNKKQIWLGRYKTAEEAHRVYVDACKKYRGEYSVY